MDKNTVFRGGITILFVIDNSIGDFGVVYFLLLQNESNIVSGHSCKHIIADNRSDIPKPNVTVLCVPWAMPINSVDSVTSDSIALSQICSSLFLSVKFQTERVWFHCDFIKWLSQGVKYLVSNPIIYGLDSLRHWCKRRATLSCLCISYLRIFTHAFIDDIHSLLCACHL